MKVLVVHEDSESSDIIKMCVENHWPGSSVIWASRGSGVVELVQKEGPDIVLLSLELPDIDGHEVLRKLRDASDVPIIAMSYARDDYTLPTSLQEGADRFLSLPFLNHNEISLTILTVLRRAGSAGWDAPKAIRLRGISINLAARLVFRDGKEVPLTAIEWALMAYLARNRGKTATHQILAEKVWGKEEAGASSIKMCVHRLRQKLGDNTRRPMLIVSHRGIGYSLVQ